MPEPAKTISQLAPQCNTYRMTREEISHRYLVGKKWYHAKALPPGCKDQALAAVNLFLFMEGYGRGFEDERAELLTQWLTDLRSPRSESHRKELEGDCLRAVHWKAKGKPEGMSDELIDKLCATKVYLPRHYKWANLNKSNLARAKILEAFQRLEAEGKFVGVKSLARESGCALETVRKHADIWKTEPVAKGETPNNEGEVLGEGSEKKKEAIVFQFSESSEKSIVKRNPSKLTYMVTAGSSGFTLTHNYKTIRGVISMAEKKERDLRFQHEAAVNQPLTKPDGIDWQSVYEYDALVKSGEIRRRKMADLGATSKKFREDLNPLKTDTA